LVERGIAGGGGNESVEVAMRERFETNVAAGEGGIFVRDGFSMHGGIVRCDATAREKRLTAKFAKNRR
jgi:hypothetical protein